MNSHCSPCGRRQFVSSCHAQPRRGLIYLPLLADKVGKRGNVRLQENDKADQARQRDTVPENVTQDLTLVSIPFGGCTGHHDALGIDHLAHDAAGAVR